ncbi:bifunctional adenosylcobinamide kinase/adenosylcobinamide-phosphate guanylyltransferase [Marinobacterium jannaschii]|uniref:bifunctional adenosylcobinamide kinase/adenosylcobinamide-phosphate guanylyltransferase n=1 Tax=Marinobacterium jannaschii TaxID=64970 RepID=UPI000485A159|nr:bifunctional adenosylcobinamide kinase/adenosylcobinamide-phosphate guanylyltransferase [Marinobacterium jannaschii]
MKQLILGGARSGKSRLAQERASGCGAEVIYIATATAGEDSSMAQRIERHRQNRPQVWQVIEEPLYLADQLREQASEGRVILVDCLTLWLTNLLLKDRQLMAEQVDKLQRQLPELPGQIILVSNEVGLGIVPMGELSRTFQDETGLLHQRLAELCDKVTLTVAGLPLELKGADL